MALKSFQKVFKSFCRIGEMLKKLQGVSPFEIPSKAGNGVPNTQGPRVEEEP